MSDAFDRLSPAIQYQIVNHLGFRGLRPVQELSAHAILDGANCVVLAPTAGGKTEAAFFPLLSRMDREDWSPISVVYVAPIRALLNNLEPRVSQYAQMLGRRAFKWHGDVAVSEKKGFVQNPGDILLTTPESLEVMLMSRKVPTARVFAGLQAVVIDEIHAFAGDDRGGHLASILERLTRFCGRDIQRIGLSATVGNPEAILQWVAGSSKREGRVVDAGGARKEPAIAIDWVATLPNAAKMIAALHPGKKRLVFVDSRRRVEALGQALRDEGVDTYVTHSSLSVDERLSAERAFENAQNCVIVATSALELGIDIGDLDHVIQIDAPPSVAAFLQRMGRTGRRATTLPNCTFLVVEDRSLLQAAAIVWLFRQGFVEPVRIANKASHLLAHQLMALTIQQEGGVPVSDWWAWLSSAAPFQGLSESDRRELVEHMLAEDILFISGGRYCLGARGEKLYGWKNFSELYAVFSAPQTLRVVFGAHEVGSIDAQFAQQQPMAKLTFILAAKAWRAVAIDWKEGILKVEPIGDGGLVRWQGSPSLLGRRLCGAIREILQDATFPAEWSQRAQAKITELRAEYEVAVGAKLAIVPDHQGLRLWTFAGGRANNLLARILESKLGGKVVTDNLYIGFREGAAASEVAIRQALDEMRAEERPHHDDALAFAESCAKGRLSKFQPCLPERLEAEFLASVLTDCEEAKTAISLR